ncbi:MAG: cytochrome c-type biogenesis protein [Motiliproteus sp.]
MKRTMRLMAMLGLLLASWSAQAVIETYQFKNEQEKQQYKVLVEELRCPKCQNQNLSGSNSPIAEDMRREIHRMVSEGQSSQTVIDFMVARYGDFVNYRPRRDSSTMLLWYGPIAMLVIGALVVLLVSRRKRGGSDADVKAIDPAAQEKLKRLLDDKDAR